jgi:hypothetical protein
MLALASPKHSILMGPCCLQGVPKQDIAPCIGGQLHPGRGFEPALSCTSCESREGGGLSQGGAAEADKPAVPPVQQQQKGGKGGGEGGSNSRWPVLEAKLRGSDPLERLQVCVCMCVAYASCEWECTQ